MPHKSFLRSDKADVICLYKVSMILRYYILILRLTPRILTHCNQKSNYMSTKLTGTGCGCYMVYLIIQAALGWWASEIFFRITFNHDIPWWADLIIGLFVGIPLFVIDLIVYIISEIRPEWFPL
jgi:hypothetical protein